LGPTYITIWRFHVIQNYKGSLHVTFTSYNEMHASAMLTMIWSTYFGR